MGEATIVAESLRVRGRLRAPALLEYGEVGEDEIEIALRRGAPGRAVASPIANQASFEVVRVLAGFMTTLARERAPEAVVGLPTLGLAFAPLVAEARGCPHFVPLGYSRKYWYDEALSVPVACSPRPASRGSPAAGSR